MEQTNKVKETTKAKDVNNVGVRGRFMMPVFKDEYEAQGIKNEMTLGEARAHLRTKLEFENPARQKVGSASGKIRANLKEATDEQKEAIAKILGC